MHVCTFCNFFDLCTLCTFLVKAVHLRSMDKKCCALFNLWCTLCSLVHFMFPETLKQAYLGNQLSVHDEPKNKLYTRRWVTICAILYDSDLLSEEVADGSEHLAHQVVAAAPKRCPDFSSESIYSGIFVICVSWKPFDFKSKRLLQTKGNTWKWLSGQF